MSYFPDTIAAQLAGRVVRSSILARFDFATSPRNLWLGAGRLWAGGEFWEGIGEFGSISGLEAAMNGNAPMARFTLSGVDPELVPLALNSAATVKGRDVTVYLQFFDEAMQTLDEPFAVYSGTLDVMRIRASGPGTRTIEVTSETVFVRRARPPWGYLTDRDQQKLFPGDRGLELMPAMVNKTVTWPVF